MKTYLLLAFLGWGLVYGTAPAYAQEAPLGRPFYRNGDETVKAFASVCRGVRDSVVKLNVDGETVALGVVMDSRGSVFTKASELKKGKLTAWLAVEREVPAKLIATDESLDLALIRVEARGLKPITWSLTPATLGQWAVTPGVIENPHAVGVISATPRKIRSERPFLGVLFDNGANGTRIDEVLPGLGAEKAGLQSGDELRKINGQAVGSRSQVVEILSELREGQTVKVDYQRGDEVRSVQIKLMVPVESRGASIDQAQRLAGATSLRLTGFEQVIEHDTVLQPWLCGGPLVNIRGEAIGLNIARAGRVSTYALPAQLVQDAYKKLNRK